jgi:hypothetical protein
MNRRALLLSAPGMLASARSRGKAAIAEYWKRYYSTPQAPFSWRPDRVAAPDGKVFARFYSTWRSKPSGAWRIVFDDGCNLQEQCNANAVQHP